MQPVRCRESIFDLLALDYDGWFEDEGKLLFAIEAEAFRRVLPSLPKPWLEVGVGSGRFAQALGIENGIDPSVRCVPHGIRTSGYQCSSPSSP